MEATGRLEAYLDAIYIEARDGKSNMGEKAHAQATIVVFIALSGTCFALAHSRSVTILHHWQVQYYYAAGGSQVRTIEGTRWRR